MRDGLLANDAANEENELIISAQHGDQIAAEELIQRHHALIWSLANRMSYGMHAMAEELVQAGYIGLLCAIEKYDASRTAKLITYAVPWILGEMKRTLRTIRIPHEWIPLEETAETTEKRPLIETLECKSDMEEEAVDLHLALQRLAGDEQKLLCLRYFRDKTQKETAILLRKSQAQISRIECAALEKLKRMLS